MSPRTNTTRWPSIRSEMFARFTAYVSLYSTTRRTGSPRRTIMRTKFVPMNPAAPVTRMVRMSWLLRLDGAGFLVRPALRNGIAGLEIEVDVLPRVGPPPVQLVGGHLPPLDVGVVHVRDFQFVPRRRLERLDDVEDLAVVEIDPDDGPVALRVRRLLHDPHDAFPLHFRHAVGLRILDLREQDLRALALVTESPDRFLQRVLDDVVAEDQADRVAVGEVL